MTAVLQESAVPRLASVAFRACAPKAPAPTPTSPNAAEHRLHVSLLSDMLLECWRR